MKRHSSVTILTGCCLALLALHCNQQQKLGADTRAADEAAIRQADIAWSKTGETRNLEAMMLYYTEDAVVLLPDMPMAIGKEAIRKAFGPVYETPGFFARWQPAKVEVARSGDIGYVQGTAEITMNDPKGAPMSRNGKYIEIWKKQADGNWKCAIDILNFDLPAPQPPSK